MSADTLRCKVSNSESKTLVIILRSSLLNLILDWVVASSKFVSVFAILLLEWRWAIQLLVWAESVTGGSRNPNSNSQKKRKKEKRKKKRKMKKQKKKIRTQGGERGEVEGEGANPNPKLVANPLSPRGEDVSTFSTLLGQIQK